jgi:hypothetical protein
MNEKQTRTDRMSIGWPFLGVSEDGVNSMVDGLAVYRNLTKGLTDMARQYLTGGYEEIVGKWRKNVENGSQEMIEIFLSPYRQVDSLSAEGKAFGENLLRSWQRLTGMEFPTESPKPRGMEEWMAFYEKGQKSTRDLLDTWQKCLLDLAEAYRVSSTRWENPRQAWETWLSACETFRDTVTAANISFFEVQADASHRFLKSFIPEKVQTETEIREDEETQPRKTGRKGRS